VDQLARDKKIDPAAIEVWFADEARVGQKNKITRRWARRGSRPSAPHDQRIASTISSAPSAPRTARARPLSCPLQHRGDEPASGRDRDGSGAGCARRARARLGRLAPVRQAHRAAEHHARPAAVQMPRIQSGRECVAVFIRDNWLSNRVFRSLRRHPRTLLLCLEQARRPALDDYVDRIARLGTAVLINGTWYNFSALSRKRRGQPVG
jgi:hypothetical protein